MSRIKWEVARRIIGRFYLVQPNNWPHRFAPVHLAHLQCPQEQYGKSHTDACLDAIEYAAGIGELPFTVESFKFPPSAAAFDSIMDAPESEIADKWLAECSMQELPAISASDFRRWLETHGDKPSEHVQAWFDARCTKPVPKTPPATPDNEPSKKRKGWRDYALVYIKNAFKSGQYGTAKELHHALLDQTGPDSPFERGTGTKRGGLIVRETGKTLALKTLQNAWNEVIR